MNNDLCSNGLQFNAYVTKKDFIDSIAKPKKLWFIDENKISCVIAEQIKEIYVKQAKKANIDYDNYLFGDDNQIDDDENDILIDEIEFDPKIKNNAHLLEAEKFFENFANCVKNKFPDYRCVDFQKEFNIKNSQEKNDYLFKYYLNEKKIIIFKPIFLSNGIAKANPSAIIKENEKISLYIAFASTKLKVIQGLDLIYQYQVINECLIQNNFKPIDLHNYQIYLIKNCINKKNCLEMFSTQALCWTKSSKEKIPNNNEKNFFALYDLKTYLTEENQEVIKHFIYFLNKINFWNWIKEINLQKKHYKTLDSFNLPEPNDTIFKFKNPIYLSQFKQLCCCSNKYHFIGYNGNWIKWKKSIEIEKLYIDKYKNSAIKFDDYISHILFIRDHQNIFFDKNITKPLQNAFKYIKEIKKNNSYYIPIKCKQSFRKKLKPKKIYFDFETISLAFSIMDDTKPYQQICTQVSIIRDFNEGKTVDQMSKNNFILDPKRDLNTNNMEKIIDLIFENVDVNDIDNYSFVVYNKNFESNILKQMKNIVSYQHKRKIDFIINHIFDLADYFNMLKDTGCYILPLKGYYSIKYVLNYIMNNDYNIYKSVGCSNYKNLEIHNGAQAQNTTIMRFFDQISDKEWLQTEKNLKMYCENDVKAMIALEYWLREKGNE